jgi:DNA-directed RNA polymerase subunit RPC12/RpoP
VYFGMPEQVNAFIGYCFHCKKKDSLIFVMKDQKSEYLHCMYCNRDFVGPKHGSA